jgi:hypothetical protein
MKAAATEEFNPNDLFAGINFGDDALPTTPWDFQDAFGMESLPERPSDSVFSDQQEEDNDTAEVTSEDYDGAERVIYIRLRTRIRDACNVNTVWKKRKKAAYWIFASNTEDDSGNTFNLMCRSLGARPSVVQARLQFQLYKVGVPYPEPLPFLTDRMPETVATEILFHAGQDGLQLARHIWLWPGIRADILRREVDDIPESDFMRITQRLEEAGHIALKHGFWFLTSRNPELVSARHRRTFHWSNSFFADT